MLIANLTALHPLRRAGTALLVGVLLNLIAWAAAYSFVPEGALREALGIAALPL